MSATAPASALVIDRPVQPGESFAHNGPIVFKVFAADGVRAHATNGEVILEQGGGHRLCLISERKQQSPLSLKRLFGGNRAGGRVVAGDLVGGRGGQDGPETGIIIRGDLGDNAILTTAGRIAMANAGAALQATAGGSLTAGDTGHASRLQAGGRLCLGHVGSNAHAHAGGSLSALSLAAGTSASAGGSAEVGTAAVGCRVEAGGALKVGQACTGSSLIAGGSLTLGSMQPGVSLSAGGSITVGGQKQGRKGPRR